MGKNKLKIAFVVDLPFPSNSAGSFRIEDTAKNLAEEHEVFVICRRKLRDSYGLNIVEVGGFLGGALNFPLFVLRAAWALKKIKPDKIVVSSPPMNSLFLSLLFPIIADLRDCAFFVDRKLVPFPYPYYLLAKLFERRLANRAKKVVVVSPMLKGQFPDAEYIPNGTDTTMFAPGMPKGWNPESIKAKLGIPNKKMVLYAGSVSEYHAPDFLLEAMQLSRERGDNLEYVFAGGGNQMPYLKREAARLGLENVLFLGNIPRDELAAYINSADACIATISPGYPTITIKVFDYMACNKPIVANLASYEKLFGAAVGKTPAEFVKKLKAAAEIAAGTKVDSRKRVLAEYDRQKLSHKYVAVINES